MNEGLLKRLGKWRAAPDPAALARVKRSAALNPALLGGENPESLARLLEKKVPGVAGGIATAQAAFAAGLADIDARLREIAERRAELTRTREAAREEIKAQLTALSRDETLRSPLNALIIERARAWLRTLEIDGPRGGGNDDQR